MSQSLIIKTNYLVALATIAGALDRLGKVEEADIIDSEIFSLAQKLNSVDNIRQADLTNYISPDYVADALRRVIYYMMYRAKISNRDKFMYSIRKGLLKLNPVELSTKKTNPGSAIGAAINMIRGVLTGQFPTVSAEIIAALERTL